MIPETGFGVFANIIRIPGCFFVLGMVIMNLTQDLAWLCMGFRRWGAQVIPLTIRRG